MESWRTRAAVAHCDSHGWQSDDCFYTYQSPSHGKQLMSQYSRSSRIYAHSLAIAFAVACGIALSSSAQAQMAAGSGCTNCGSNVPGVTYSGVSMTQNAQAIPEQSYPVTSYPGETTIGHGCGSNGGTACSSGRRHCSSRRSIVRYRQPSRSYGARYSSVPAYSNSCGCSGGVSYPSASTYPSSTVVSYGTPVMQTGAGCPGGNCR